MFICVIQQRRQAVVIWISLDGSQTTNTDLSSTQHEILYIVGTVGAFHYAKLTGQR